MAQLTPDGGAALFLRSGPRSAVQSLHETDLVTGETRLLAYALDEKIVIDGNKLVTDNSIMPSLTTPLRKLPPIPTNFSGVPIREFDLERSGTGGGESEWRYVVRRDGGQAVDADRQAVAAWLAARREVAEVVVGPLVDLTDPD